jgi:rhodanese-related sulfurtransferase
MAKRHAVVIALVVSALGVAGARAVACPSESQAAAPQVKQVTLSELDKLIKEEKVSIFDANSDKTRAKYGVIPGAVLLSDIASYPLDVLPSAKDRKLVFYCANTRCTASHVAAQRALENGYADVSVLPDGIMGWKQAGKATQQVPRS